MEPEWINKGQAVALLGISEDRFDDLLDAGLLPVGLKASRKAVLWRRTEIQAVAVLLPLLLAALERLSSPDPSRK